MITPTQLFFTASVGKRLMDLLMNIAQDERQLMEIEDAIKLGVYTFTSLREASGGQRN